MEKKLVIHHFTDPLCFWCYAMEPEMRKIRVLLGDQLEYRIVMGVLSSDVSEIIGDGPDAAARFELLRAQLSLMAEHIVNAAKAIGMPINAESFLAREPREFVSLPLSRAYCAMRAFDEGFAEAYLRRMRECVYAEGRSLATTEDLVDLAAEFPVDAGQFQDNLENGLADEILQEGISTCWTYGVTAFPTLLLEYDDKKAGLSGYHSYEELKQGIAQFTDGEISLSDAEYSIGALEAYVNRYGKVAAREVQTMFSLNDAQLANVMMDLAETGRYTTQRCGTSYFVVPKESA